MTCPFGWRRWPSWARPPVDPTSLTRVLVLLPPSQGKASPDHGRRAGLSTLVYSRLREPRDRLIDAVDPGLRTAPAIRAAELYTGVLFAALGLADLPWDGVLISSALWGVIRPGDRIPAYRLDMSAKPPGIGGLAAYWREPLRSALPDRGLVLDLRSSSYAAAWQPRRATADGPSSPTWPSASAARSHAWYFRPEAPSAPRRSRRSPPRAACASSSQTACST